MECWKTKDSQQHSLSLLEGLLRFSQDGGKNCLPTNQSEKDYYLSTKVTQSQGTQTDLTSEPTDVESKVKGSHTFPKPRGCQLALCSPYGPFGTCRRHQMDKNILAERCNDLEAERAELKAENSRLQLELVISEAQYDSLRVRHETMREQTLAFLLQQMDTFHIQRDSLV